MINSGHIESLIGRVSLYDDDDELVGWLNQIGGRSKGPDAYYLKEAAITLESMRRDLQNMAGALALVLLERDKGD